MRLAQMSSHITQDQTMDMALLETTFEVYG